MGFLFLVVMGVAVFCCLNGYLITGLVTLIGVSDRIGFVALAFTAISLYLRGHWIVGTLPLLVIVFYHLYLSRVRRGLQSG
jgi:hypothetical protein